MTPDLPQTSRGWFLHGMWHAAGLPALMLLTTMCGIGGLVRDIGFPVWAGSLSTLLIWAGPAQVILFGAVGAGASLPATAFAIALSSARFMPMTVSLLPLLRKGGAGLGATALSAHLVSMTTWVEGLRRLPEIPPEGRVPYFLGFGAFIIGCATLATHAGYYMYTLLPTVLVAGFLFMTPLFFASAMIAGARRLADWVALSIGFFLTPLLVQYLPAGFDFLIIGVAGGSIAYWIDRRRRSVRSSP